MTIKDLRYLRDNGNLSDEAKEVATAVLQELGENEEDEDAIEIAIYDQCVSALIYDSAIGDYLINNTNGDMREAINQGNYELHDMAIYYLHKEFE